MRVRQGYKQYRGGIIQRSWYVDVAPPGEVVFGDGRRRSDHRRGTFVYTSAFTSGQRRPIVPYFGLWAFFASCFSSSAREGPGTKALPSGPVPAFVPDLTRSARRSLAWSAVVS